MQGIASDHLSFDIIRQVRLEGRYRFASHHSKREQLWRSTLDLAQWSGSEDHQVLLPQAGYRWNLLG